MTSHPSFYALDLLHLGAGSTTDREHLAQCPTCSSYLGRLEQPVAVPTELPGREQPRRWRLWAPVGLAAAAAVVAVVASPLLRPPLEVRTKGPSAPLGTGMPAVSVFLKRGEQVLGWNGEAPVQTGDSIRLEVQPERFGYLAVLSGEQQLFAGPVTSPRHALPLSWRVDAEPADVELRLVFSAVPLSASEAVEASRQQLRSARVWSTALVLHKAPVPDASP